MPFLAKLKIFGLLFSIESLISLSASTAFAEYRAYLLTISNLTSGQARNVISTLDHIQYPGYFHLKKAESITLTDTWMCWGRHGENQRPCMNPRANTDTAPSSRTAPPPQAPKAP